MEVNKIILNEVTVLDLTSDTVTASDVANGKSFHLASGEQSVGSASLLLIASTDEEMEALLVEENMGKVVKFIGTSEIYETNGFYVIGE